MSSGAGGALCLGGEGGSGKQNRRHGLSPIWSLVVLVSFDTEAEGIRNLEPAVRSLNFFRFCARGESSRGHNIFEDSKIPRIVTSCSELLVCREICDNLFPVPFSASPAGCHANVLDLGEILDLCVTRVKDEFEKYTGNCEIASFVMTLRFSSDVTAALLQASAGTTNGTLWEIEVFWCLQRQMTHRQATKSL